jgi:hypothetical protein
MFDNSFGDSRGLPAHLAAGVAQFRRRLHRIDDGVNLEASIEIVRRRRSKRIHCRNRVHRSCAALQMRAQPSLDTVGVGHAAARHVCLQPERMGVRTGGEKPVGELQ